MFEQEVEDVWNSLDKDYQLRVFYAVIKRMYKAELVDKGTFRYAIYDVFGFGPEAYAVGMDCGYLALHNALVENELLDAMLSGRNPDGSITY